MTDVFSRLVLENDDARMVFIPELGGKMIELTNKKTGTQFLKEPHESFGSYKKASYAASYESFDASGFDECFPTISPSRIMYGREIALPDHGELWTQSWQHESDGTVLRMYTHGVQIDYMFIKTIKLVGNSIVISYELKNNNTGPFNYLWSAHPLLNVAPQSELLLPPEIKQVMVEWSAGVSTGKRGDILPWPCLTGSSDFSIVPDLSARSAVKLFTDRLHTGYAGLYRTDVDESIIVRFNVDDVPYLGIWLCYGGWPVESKEKHVTVGLEPTTSRSDSLEESVTRREHAVVAGGSTVHWELEISLMYGRASIA